MDRGGGKEQQKKERNHMKLNKVEGTRKELRNTKEGNEKRNRMKAKKRKNKKAKKNKSPDEGRKEPSGWERQRN
ncbi:hypothetical protein Pmani_020309 [Petrolisthes manimaculis]|uniref:Uncharacterized protein n=1 Tax=Petrolisthes manimaculis TaxID=1843537 RepID=A0AAE1PIZ1_9EUCA|nr:hypothetical protein Pmani_020309 [Petrolisthes manimaculis]